MGSVPSFSNKHAWTPDTKPTSGSGSWLLGRCRIAPHREAPPVVGTGARVSRPLAKESAMDLHRWRRNWLAQAEVSPSGISFFFPDRCEYEAFAEVVQLPESARRDAAEVAELFDLVPRRWVKVHAEGGGFSQYHVIHAARNPYPITTLRQVVRRYRQGDPGLLEAGLKPALERPESLFAFILKNGVLRLSVRLPRELLSEALAALCQAGLLSEALAAAHRSYDFAMGASAAVYLTLEPGNPEVLSVDYERPNGHTKCRFHQGRPVLSDYRALPETLSEDQLAALCQVDQHHPEWSPPDQLSPQLGRLPQGLQPTHRDLAARAGVTPGMSVLALGCEPESWAEDLQQEIPDLNLQVLAASPREAAQARDRGVRAVAGDLGDLPFPDDSLDRVVVLESFANTPDPARALTETHRVLRPGGRLFLKDFWQRPGPLSPAQRLELAEFQRVHRRRTLRLCDLPALSHFEVQELQPPYRLQVNEATLYRRFFDLPLVLQGLLSPPKAGAVPSERELF